MTFKNYAGVFGALLVAAGGMSPMIHIGIFGMNWNYWKLDVTLATIVYFFVAVGLISAITGKQGLLRFSGWLILLVLIFTLVASYFKAHDYFSFIPMKKLAAKLTGIVHYRWTGWGMIFAGSFIMILAGSKTRRVPVVAAPETPPEPVV